MLVQPLGLLGAALVDQQLDGVAEAAAGAIDVAPQQQRDREVLVGFGVAGVDPFGLPVGLQGAGEVALLPANQAEVVPAQADLRGDTGGPGTQGCLLYTSPSPRDS